MRFYAHVRMNSPLHGAWKRAGRLSGFVEGVKFNLNSRFERYESPSALTTEQIDTLRNHPHIELEMLSATTSGVT